MKALAFALLAVLILSAFSIALVVRPVALSDTAFFVAVSWLIFLLIINWGVAVWGFSGKSSSSIFAILPSLSLIVFIYSIFSVGLTIFYWLQTNFGSLPPAHWVFQTCGFALIATLVILQLLASKAADIGNRSDLPSKESLVSVLEIKRASLAPNAADLRDALFSLERAIKHSIPHLTVLRDQEQYKLLADGVNELFKSDAAGSDWISRLEKLRRVADTVR